MNFPILGAAITAVRTFFAERDAMDKIIIGAVLFYAGIIVSTAAAGFARAITPAILIKAGFFLFFISLFCALKFSSKKLTLKKNQTDNRTLQSDVCHPQTSLGVPHLRSALGTMNCAPTILLSIAITSFALLVTFLWSSAAPPPPWDAFVYHLTFPARWIQEKEIFLVTVPFGDQAGTYFPSNTELFYLWLMLPFREEFLTTIGQFLFLLLLGGLIYKIAETGGVRSENAVAAALITTVIPEMLHQATASEVDVVFAALFVATVYFQIRCWREKYRPHFFILASLSFGLFIGTKYIALTFGALLLPFFLYSIIRSRRSVRYSFLFLCIIAASGGFWYIRNWLVTGNPVFPLTVSIAGAEIFPGGYMRSTMLNSVFHATSYREFLPLMRKVAGIPFLIALCIYFPFGVRSILRLRSARFASVYPVALPSIMLVIYWFAIPYNREWRFTFAIFALFSLFFAYAMEGEDISSEEVGARHALPLRHYIRTILKILFPIVLVLVLILNQFFTSAMKPIYESIFTRTSQSVLAGMRTPMWAALAGSMFFLCGTGISVLGKKKTKITGLLFAIPFLCLIFLLTSLIKQYPQYKYQYYTGFPIGEAWHAFNRNVTEPVTVAYTGSDLSYGLFGLGLKNRVVYVSVDRYAEWKFHDYVKIHKVVGDYSVPTSDRINFHRLGADYNDWLRNLEDADTDYLFVTVLHQTDRPHIPHDSRGFPVERIWAEQHPETFQKVYENPTTAIYRISYQK
ncbi:MAG: hypothetical protein AB1546_13940 [bacterium]